MKPFRSWTTRLTLAVSLCVVSSWTLLSPDLAQCQAGKVEPNTTLADCEGVSCPFRYTCGIFPRNPFKAKTINGTPPVTAPHKINGFSQEPGMWPAYASVAIWREFWDESWKKIEVRKNCGGVLITDRHVLTRAHCLRSQDSPSMVGARDVFVSLGKHEVRPDEDSDKIQLFAAKTLSQARSYKFLGIHAVHDYGIIKLEFGADLNGYVQPACLPYQHIHSYDQCWMVGEGLIKAANATQPSTIQMLQVEPAACNTTRFKDDHSRQCWIRAKGAPQHEGTSVACLSDSGGPILCHQGDSQRWVLVGLVSYTTGGCFNERSTPVTIATNVKALLSIMKRDGEF